MPPADWLLELLVCPECRAEVRIKPDSSGLRCVSCHRVYPIRDDIPVMLVSEATIEPADSAKAGDEPDGSTRRDG